MTLRHTVTVLRLEGLGTTSEWNVPERAYVTLTTTQKALVQERTGREVQYPDRDGPSIAQAVIYLPWGADVTEHDIVVLDAEEWDVLAVRDGGGAGHHLEADAQRIRL